MPSSIELILTLPPGLAAAELDALPALRAAFARGPATVSRLPGEAWWFRRFGIDTANELPGAAFRAPDGGAGGWRLCADPVHLRVVGDAVALDADAVAAIGADEARGLADRLDRHFAEDGLRFEVITPREWLLHCPRAFDARTRPTTDAHGRSIETLLPEGPDTRSLKRVINEAQMLLFEAPENQAREARGAAAVNGLWLWGGAATRPRVTPIPGLLLASDITHRRALAEAAGGAALPLAHDALDATRLGGTLWLDVDARGLSPEAWLGTVRTWLERLATHRGRASVSLRLPDGTVSAPLFARDLLGRFRRGGVARAVRNAGFEDAALAEIAS